MSQQPLTAIIAAVSGDQAIWLLDRRIVDNGSLRNISPAEPGKSTDGLATHGTRDTPGKAKLPPADLRIRRKVASWQAMTSLP